MLVKSQDLFEISFLISELIKDNSDLLLIKNGHYSAGDFGSRK
jgi:hypothetical protein